MSGIRATYRLQLNRDFGFAHAREILPYLADLGISHVYASPFLKARPGSSHGYDIVDHGVLNPELGSDDDFERFVHGLQALGMGLILDFVPNHMGVGGADNAWWLDVLECGRASAYADFFDIDWLPVRRFMRRKILLPFLGSTYGDVLAGDDLRLVFDAGSGRFRFEYFEHRFPVDPGTYPFIFVVRPFEGSDDVRTEFESLAAAFRNLPSRDTQDAGARRERRRDKDVLQRRLARQVGVHPELAAHLSACVALFGGNDPAARARRHDLLEAQAYRLAFWQVAADEINYRRFFDINSLAGLRMERAEVFSETHRQVLDWVERGMLAGLRIDHPDGLHDPAAYFERLRSAVRARLGPTADGFFIVVEKILAGHESLPDWPVDGTTGYDFLNLVGGLFVYAPAERELSRLYARFSRGLADFEQIVYRSKKKIIRLNLSSELTVLVNRLGRLAEADPDARDFTLNALREALIEIVAWFPVYRTYIAGAAVDEADQRHIDWAIGRARKQAEGDPRVYDFIRDVLLGRAGAADWRREARAFTMAFQQYTAPVAAKGVEDTAFYIYNRLVSLNDVGGDPARFGVSVRAFHHINGEIQRRWPRTLLATSTHDTKRSEDVRLRIHVLTEAAAEWRARVTLWGRMNRRHKTRLDDGRLAPDRDDEYLLYQTLVGSCPVTSAGDDEEHRYTDRIAAYLQKAAREAKEQTNWVRPDPVYEEALERFIRRILKRHPRNRFPDDLRAFVRTMAPFGFLNSLSQTVLKLTAPGVPDIYQGTEIWDDSLVDPDNRRSVDFRHRSESLGALDAAASENLEGLLATLTADPTDGRIKLFAVSRLLRFRREHEPLFREGRYVPVDTAGTKAEHLCAFCRVTDDEQMLVVVPRWLCRLTGGRRAIPGTEDWGDTAVICPADLGPAGPWRDILVGGGRNPAALSAGNGFAAAGLLAAFPAAVLHRGARTVDNLASGRPTAL